MLELFKYLFVPEVKYPKLKRDIICYFTFCLILHGAEVCTFLLSACEFTGSIGFRGITNKNTLEEAGVFASLTMYIVIPWILCILPMALNSFAHLLFWKILCPHASLRVGKSKLPCEKLIDQYTFVPYALTIGSTYLLTAMYALKIININSL